MVANSGCVRRGNESRERTSTFRPTCRASGHGRVCNPYSPRGFGWPRFVRQRFALHPNSRDSRWRRPPPGEKRGSAKALWPAASIIDLTRVPSRSPSSASLPRFRWFPASRHQKNENEVAFGRRVGHYPDLDRTPSACSPCRRQSCMGSCWKGTDPLKGVYHARQESNTVRGGETLRRRAFAGGYNRRERR